MITRAQQQRNATATQFDYSELFARRMKEYERTYEGQIFFVSTLNALSRLHGLKIGTLDLLQMLCFWMFRRRSTLSHMNGYY